MGKKFPGEKNMLGEHNFFWWKKFYIEHFLVTTVTTVTTVTIVTTTTTVTTIT